MRPEGFLQQVYNQLKRFEIPKIKMKKRNLSNLVYDEETRQFRIGDKTEIRDGSHVKQIKPLTQLVWIATVANKLMSSDKTCTLRDLYYMAKDPELIGFEDQKESNDLITDLETTCEMSREQFNIYPEERSEIFGRMTVEYTSPQDYVGRRINLTINPDGIPIGPRMTKVRFIEIHANKVIVVEKGAVFTRLLEEKAYERFNAILVHTAGQPPRSTRILVRRLNQELRLPVYIFNDADPWGLGIAMTMTCGSVKSSHIPGLVTPDAKWSGLYATDISQYNLPSEKLNERDVKRLLSLRNDPRTKSDPWKRELNEFLRNKRKCELETFSRYGLEYFVNNYLPQKLE